MELCPIHVLKGNRAHDFFLAGSETFSKKLSAYVLAASLQMLFKDERLLPLALSLSSHSSCDDLNGGSFNAIQFSRIRAALVHL